ncbi:unnamed protein product [Chondrus crispus]|uniref:Uncharacterized protein n=1 Tax=Chondrus crispus TaxID=2769 RepID=R7QD17_CHOCR|nr:unnamed protein product [Chondrus crispus]XP_005715164.1 unnamed protein product [Chondrus crispus]CDF33205.1 unnamed protein product [Chondrus crispus]CDF35345.1 unnamed protein product [Chondrus crispus]|eukprot:XP_005713008.1 unnamed protein product [Chondrus crispus]
MATATNQSHSPHSRGNGSVASCSTLPDVDDVLYFPVGVFLS